MARNFAAVESFEPCRVLPPLAFVQVTLHRYPVVGKRSFGTGSH